MKIFEDDETEESNLPLLTMNKKSGTTPNNRLRELRIRL